jgi:hypothetical protein
MLSSIKSAYSLNVSIDLDYAVFIFSLVTIEDLCGNTRNRAEGTDIVIPKHSSPFSGNTL